MAVRKVESDKEDLSSPILFIALLFRILGVVDLKDFRSISLIRGIYKIISMVLANYLYLVMDKLYLSLKILLLGVDKS